MCICILLDLNLLELIDSTCCINADPGTDSSRSSSWLCFVCNVGGGCKVFVYVGDSCHAETQCSLETDIQKTKNSVLLLKALIHSALQSTERSSKARYNDRTIFSLRVNKRSEKSNRSSSDQSCIDKVTLLSLYHQTHVQKARFDSIEPS